MRAHLCVRRVRRPQSSRELFRYPIAYMAEPGFWSMTEKETQGLRAFEVADADRTLYHAAAVIGGNFLVTLHDVAVRLLAEAGAPPEAIVPLMARTIDNRFDLTGPIARGDWTTVEAHLAVLAERAPDLVPLYQRLAEATRR